MLEGKTREDQGQASHFRRNPGRGVKRRGRFGSLYEMGLDCEWECDWDCRQRAGQDWKMARVTTIKAKATARRIAYSSRRQGEREEGGWAASLLPLS